MPVKKLYLDVLVTRLISSVPQTPNTQHQLPSSSSTEKDHKGHSRLSSSSTSGKQLSASTAEDLMTIVNQSIRLLNSTNYSYIAASS